MLDFPFQCSQPLPHCNSRVIYVEVVVTELVQGLVENLEQALPRTVELST